MPWLLLVALCSCGRIAFDDVSVASDAIASDAPTLPVCIEDDFSDGVADGWTNDAANWGIVPGPSGPAFGTSSVTPSFTSRTPTLRRDELDVELDLVITNPGSGDVFLQLINGSGEVYQATLHPIGSDDPIDTLIDTATPTTPIAQAANRLAGAAWVRVRLVYRASTMDVFVDDVLHLHGVDSAYAPPLSLNIGFNQGGGAFDSLTLRCR